MHSALPNAANLASESTFGVDPHTLQPHPRNAFIYGEEEDISELVALIESSGWVKPLVITPNRTIISGHRRWKAVLTLGWHSVGVEVREFQTEAEELEALLLENASREKTVEQKVREGKAWEVVEREKAKKRQVELAGNHRRRKTSDLVANLPQGRETGKTRERVSARVGMKARTYSKASQVVDLIDSEFSQGNSEVALALRQVLNLQSVDAAYQLLKQPSQKRQQILSAHTGGKLKLTKLMSQKPFDSDLAVENSDTTSPEVDGIKSLAVGDVVFINITWQEKAGIPERKWNGFWGVVQSNNMGIKVNMGVEVINVKSSDLKSVDLADEQLSQLPEVAERILRLRMAQLDELEVTMLNFMQQQVLFTSRQLDYLEYMESLHSKD
ncbi:ParB N-terminal domain-containing protein [Phormidium sp. LEGE 05292]|uniref:ParB/RepB/Spo0J family partition protein n=1 Tax=[Phormidium] sp. LEGE 05292 TaxID=767427 RepID=UPI00187F4718|nr:ParB N-terminal domain-containing protein [Phormidium sp. LEGE 05292]MBE9224758.1 ParB N-terminal domain-containing protein [Phormidium sp. LEGE 05292]